MQKQAKTLGNTHKKEKAPISRGGIFLAKEKAPISRGHILMTRFIESAATTSSSLRRLSSWQAPFSLRLLSSWLRSSLNDSPFTSSDAHQYYSTRLCPLYKMLSIYCQEKNATK
ncbi:MAG: hypothetical protein ABIR70_12135 [Bryobacteraceae bacterium]